MPRTRPPFSEEFRREAVELIRKHDRPVKETAADLGVSTNSLYKWLRQADVDQGAADGVSSDEREELRRLRRENRVLREEREILKKAAAFFARESDPTR